MYRIVLRKIDPNRSLYMAIEQEVFEGILSEPLGEAMRLEFGIELLVFDPIEKRVLRWTS